MRGMNEDGRQFRRVCEKSFELGLARIERCHAVLNLRSRDATDDCVDQALHLAVDLAKLRLVAFSRCKRNPHGRA